MQCVRLWVYKCNIASVEAGDWSEFLDAYERGGPGEWGGTDSTRDPISLHIIREEMHRGHWCWLGKWTGGKWLRCAKWQRTEYVDVASPIDSETRLMIEEKVFAAYQPFANEPVKRRL
jgi:hypothetical protein